MEFKTYSSPHLPGPGHVSRVMRTVILAAIPGVALAWWFFGWGILINLALAVATCIGAEAAMLYLRKRPVRTTLTDNSAALTGLLLALTLPPFVPWWMPVLGALFAIVIAKQLYGGLGYNPFNPAMIGYVVLLISFPREMTLWAPPHDLAQYSLSLIESLSWSLFGELPSHTSLDAVTMATPLDEIKTQLGLGLTMTEIHEDPLFGAFGGHGWEWVNLGFLAGGVALLSRRVIHWHIPAGFIGGLFLIALVFYASDSDGFASPLFHLFSGATMLGAFFIATDPITASTTPRGRLLYGAGIGILVYIIRNWGGYPDGVAFGVLLMNMAVPTIDYYTQPRVFGHEKK